MPKENKTRYAVLGVLSMGPRSGYDIKKFCDQGIAHFWHENFGAIYPVLKQLESDQMVIKTVQQSAGKPARHVYSITDKGREALHAWLLRPIEPAPARLELLLKLTFAKDIAPEVFIDELQRVSSKHRQRLAEYQALENTFNQNDEVKASTGYPYWLATIRYGIYDARFRIEWCTETIESIKRHFHI